MSAQGQYAGQYFGDYFGQAGTPVVPGVMVGTAHISFTATGLLTDGQAPAQEAPRLGSTSRSDRQRRRPGIFPALPREAEPALPLPRRTRRRREAELVLWLNH